MSRRTRRWSRRCAPLGPPLPEAAIEPLRADHDLSGFSCGVPSLDAWLHTRALRNQATGDSRVFVLLTDGKVAGFYALSTASAARSTLAGALRRNAPDPVPLLLLGQLAVDTRWHGAGFGRLLLGDACLRALDVSRRAGFRALATHPVDAAAERFYARFGFVTVPDSMPALMVLSIDRLEATARVV
jgi:GNAT superfamily N-acetyltransferase